MFVSIFGDVEYGDYASIEDWGGAHAQAHRTITRVVATNGFPVQPVILSAEHIDDDWFGRHGLAHMALQRFYLPDNTVSSTLMMSGLADWTAKDKFYDWHMMHDQIHQRLSNALGIPT